MFFLIFALAFAVAIYGGLKSKTLGGKGMWFTTAAVMLAIVTIYFVFLVPRN